MRKVAASVLAEKYHILNTDTVLARDIYAGFNRND